MPVPTFASIPDNLANLGTQILDQLKADVLGTLTDPESIAMAERATATLAMVPVAMIGAPADVAKDLQNQFDAAMTVLYSLASAAVENAAKSAADVRAKVFNIVNVVIADAIKVGFGALKLAIL